jgi:ATP-binding cassette subfamily A (ABC1) protein 3
LHIKLIVISVFFCYSAVTEDALVVEGLRKTFKGFVAVDKLNFGVHHGECFGLLGVNGAGKTTSFRMLIGDEDMDQGNAFVGSGFNLKTNRKQFLKHFGYCPQFDGFVEVLTGSEMLELFARLRGVKMVKKETQELLERIGMNK